MAGDWIKMRHDLVDDPAIDRLVELTGLDPLMIYGALYKAWRWADRQSRDGHADVTLVTLDRHIGCPGFANALVQVGWLEVTDTGVFFPHFDRHMGKSAKTRALAAQRKQRQRDRDREGRDGVTPASRSKSRTGVTRGEKRSSSSKKIEREQRERAFDEFWEKYPRKTGKPEAHKAWFRQQLGPPELPQLLAAIEEQRKSRQWSDPDFIPHPSTWLNQRRWEDAPAPKLGGALPAAERPFVC